MEDKLQKLLAISEEANRIQTLHQWKDGRKIVGLLCSYIPEEIVHAAGMRPWRIMGTPNFDTSRAGIYRPPHTCAYCNHVLESLLSGAYAPLDAVIATSWDQDLVRLWDVWTYLEKTPDTYIMHLPLDSRPTHRRQFTREVCKLVDFVEAVAGVSIGETDLAQSIALYNRARKLLHTLYEWRKRERPPLSGAETLGIVMASMLMPVEIFVDEVTRLLPYLEQREITTVSPAPRILVSSDRLDNVAFIKLVEECGCLVVMDDLDTGSRHFWNLVEIDPAATRDDMLAALALRYHSQPASPCMMTWSDQVMQVAGWVNAYRVQGVLELPLLYSRSRQMRARFFKDQLAGLGIRLASFERDYRPSHDGQLKTRIGAFVENIEIEGVFK